MTTLAVPPVSLFPHRVEVPSQVAAMSLALAGGAHLGAFPIHRAEGAIIASFFLVVAVLQIAAAAVVGRRTSARLRAVIFGGTIGVLAIWALSRTVGLPVGTHAGASESVGIVDAIAVVAQVLTIGALSWTMRSSPVRRPVSRLLLFAVVLVSSAGSAWVLRSGPAHAHVDDGSDHPAHAPAAPPSPAPALLSNPPANGSSTAETTTPTTVPTIGHSHAPGHGNSNPHAHP